MRIEWRVVMGHEAWIFTKEDNARAWVTALAGRPGSIEMDPDRPLAATFSVKRPEIHVFKNMYIDDSGDDFAVVEADK